MASYGAAKESVASMPSARGLKETKTVGKFHHMELHPGHDSTGGVVVHHFHQHPDGYGTKEHPDGPHVFGDGDGHKLAAHIEKHLGIKMPGKSGVGKAEPREGDENEGKD